MKVVILAGGLGTRLSEYTETIPKPMVNICGKPILLRIINHYKRYGFKDFIIATGYKGKKIKNFFKKKIKSIEVQVIETGLKTMTGGRLKRLQKHLSSNTFLLTYGDGLSDVNLNSLISFHKRNKRILTLTAVRPPARFGTIKINGTEVKYFKEKSSVDEGWISGGFFVVEPEIFKFIKNDQTFLERAPFEKLTKLREISAYKHYGFWQCMDTKRDKELLEKIVKSRKYKI